LTAQKRGLLKEVFGTGTAAVVSPVGCLHYDGTDYEINGGVNSNIISSMLYDTLTGIQTGRYADKFNWVTKLDRN
jgi:branched-chain amino acid aminotransferase